MRGACFARPRRVLADLIMAGCMLWLLGCNDILGIHAPADETLDSGPGVLKLRDAAKKPLTFAENDDDGGGLQASPSAPGTTHAWNDWPIPNPPGLDLPNVRSYSTRSPGVVMDNVTRLEWQQWVDAGSYTYHDAIGYCASLSLDGGGWRLPSRMELVSLLDFTSTPAIDPSAFPDTPTERFWSSSPFVGARSSAWGVHFGFSVGFVFKDAQSETHRVRCVR